MRAKLLTVAVVIFWVLGPSLFVFFGCAGSGGAQGAACRTCVNEAVYELALAVCDEKTDNLARIACRTAASLARNECIANSCP